jgi:hypothetical protein
MEWEGRGVLPTEVALVWGLSKRMNYADYEVGFLGSRSVKRKASEWTMLTKEQNSEEAHVARTNERERTDKMEHGASPAAGTCW